MESNTKIAPIQLSPNGNKSQKYIRTFESDMDLSKKGGVPGFVQLQESEISPDEFDADIIAEANTPDLETFQIPDVVPEPQAPEPEAPELQITPMPVPKPELPEPLKLPPEEMPAPIETYSEDFRQKMKDTGASTATVLAAEQDAEPIAQEAVPEDKKERRHAVLVVIAGIFLLGIGGTGIYIAYSRYLYALTPVSILSATPMPIFVDSRERVSGTGEALTRQIEQSVAEPLAVATVRALSLEASSTSVSIFSALEFPAPDILLRNINTEGSMAGVVNSGGTQSPFFILSVDSYGATFSGMLSWEPTMQDNMKELFPAYSLSDTASSTTLTTQLSTEVGFSDDTVSNHDVRIYRDAEGRSLLLYGYWNQSTLIIARDKDAFAEILRRLATSRS